MMKRFIALIIGLLIFGFAQAQDKVVVINNIDPGDYETFFGTTGDTVTNAAAKTYTFQVNAEYPFYVTFQVRSDSVSGTPSYTAKVESSMYNGNYQAISGMSNVSTTTGVDTSFHWKDSTGSQLHRFYKITVTGAATAQNTRLYGYAKFMIKK